MDRYSKYHESLNIDCGCGKKPQPKTPPPPKGDCGCGGISLPSNNGEIQMAIAQLKREVQKLLKTTEAKLLCQDKKIAETMMYVKNNLSTAIRKLLDSMLNSGELEEIINDTVLSTIDLLEATDKNLQNQITAEATNRQKADQDLQRQISGIVSNPPPIVSSVSEMTNTNIVYLNTTDGYCYYYNGSEWIRGWAYQAAQPSDQLEALGLSTILMVKDIIYGKVELTLDDEYLNVKLIPQGDYIAPYFVTDNRIFYPAEGMQTDYSFALSDYNIRSMTWALAYNLTTKSIDLIDIFNDRNSLNKDSCVLCVFSGAGSRRITEIQNGLYYNGSDISVGINKTDLDMVYRSTLMFVKDIIYGSIEMTLDAGVLTVQLKPTGNQIAPFLLTDNRIFYPAQGMQLEYVFPLSEYNINGSTWALVYDLATKRLELINIFNNRDDLTKYDCIICIFTAGNSRRINEAQNGLYYNGADISLHGKMRANESVGMDFLRCFKNFTVIGDSLACGYTKVGDTLIGSNDAKEQQNNWPSYLASRLNRTMNNLAVGGSTAKLWRDRWLTEMQADVTTDCYFVGIGVNDLRQKLNVGTVADIKSNYQQNADSFYGNYDYMIQALRSYNPDSKIFVFTIPNSEVNPNAYNNAIKYIASLYDNVFVIDLYSLYDFTSGFIAQNFYNGHYNPIAYNYISLLIEKAVNTYIYENHEPFDLIPYE